MYITLAAAFAIVIITNVTLFISNKYNLPAQEGGVIFLVLFCLGNLISLYFIAIFLITFLGNLLWIIPASVTVLYEDLSDWCKFRQGKRYNFLTKEEIKGGYLDFTKKG